LEKFIIQPHGRLQEWIAHEKGYLRAEALDFFACAKQHLTLNVEFFARHQIQTGEESSEECLEIPFEIMRGALRKQRTYFALQLFEQLAVRD